MKFRNTFLLILVFIALGLYLVFVEVPADKKKEEEETLSKKVIAFKVEDVQEFDLIKPTETIKLKRDPANSRWNISEPMAVSGEDGVINQLLLQLEEARITRVVDEEPKNLADFGLQEPQIKIALRFKTGEPRTLLVGDTSPIGHNIYLKLENDKRVLLSFLDTNQFKQPVNDLRNKALLDFVALDVTAVDLQYEQENQHWVKEGGVWKLTAPVKALGDADEISNFLNSILSERIETFVSDTTEDIEPIGLASPKIVLNILAEKAKQSWTLKIGKQYDDHSYYAQRGEPKNVVTVSDSLVETLSKNPLNFMEKSLISFKENEVTQIENRDGKDVLRVVRDPGKTGLWKFDGSETEAGEDMGAADSATVNTLLLDLQEARIQEFSPIKNLKLFGLDNPQKSLTVFTQDGTQENLSLGNPAKDNRHFFATRSRDQTIFKLDADTVKKIFRSRKDFKDKKLLKFKAEQVARIRMEYPDKTFELEKRDNQWVLIQPEKLDDLKPFVGKDILWTLNNLEYETKLTLEETGEATGLDQPQLTLTLQDRDNQSIGSLKIGQPVKDRPLLYSQLAGNPALYHIKDRTLSEIPDRMDRFRKNGD